MTLLAPLAGLLAGLLGLGGLVLLHALKLRRQPLRISSTLLWKNAAQDLEVNTPWRRPRLTALLILQALAVLFLALAIGRPVLGAGGSGASRVVVVIDATASMRATTPGGQTRFERAIAQAEDRIRALRRADRTPEIAVVRYAAAPSLVLAPTRSIGDALGAVRSITPTDQPGDTPKLRELLASMEDTAPATTDTTDGDENADTQPIPYERRNDPSLWVFTDAGSLDHSDLVGHRGEIIPAADTSADNAGIAALHASRDPDDPGTARVFLRLVSNASRPIGLIVSIDAGASPARLPVQVPAASPGAPGSLTRTINIEAPGERLITVSLDHRDRPDALATDDAAWVSIPDPSPPRTLVYAPEGRADPFLLDVVEALAPDAFSVHPPTDLNALRGADLVIYDRVTPASLPPVPTLGFASAWPTGDTANPPEFRTGRERVVAWDRAHPALRDVTLAPVVYDRAVVLPGAGVPGVSVLAESSSGPVFTETIAGGRRHIRVAFPLERSNWGVEVGMSLFVAKSFERLAPGTRGEGSVITTTQPFEAPSTAEVVRAVGPIELSAPGTARGVATLGPAERAGVYQLEGSTQRTAGVSMLDAPESMLAIGPGADFGAPSGNTPNAGDPARSGRRELWPIALLLALAFMTAEFFVHAARARI